jgi:hypothetical protein
MCLICDNDYYNHYDIFIENCQIIKEIPAIEGLHRLHITNCNNVTSINYINGLQDLNIYHCDNLKEIPNINGLKRLFIDGCLNITKIPIIEQLRNLFIYNCENIEEIPFIKKLRKMSIINCKKYLNYRSQNNIYNIKYLYNANKIKKWYKKLKLSKRLWLYAELVIIDEMNPHKENNQYLERYIKEKVYN